ncbi:MAG: TerB family tellurite resistance protein [Flavobacteriales bacterium]|nr:TerB family tellurite resistance protein [Flavobacteriales bacterium]
MAKYAKWLGGTLGWAFGGPVGALLGFALGSLYDNASGDVMNWGEPQVGTGGRTQVRTTPGDFEVSLLILTAAVMKADNSIKKSELDFVKRFLVGQFGEAKAQQQLLLLREILKKPIDIRQVSMQIRTFMDHSSRLQLMQYLFQLANADQEMHGNEIDMLTRIASYLGISKPDFMSIKAMFVIENNESVYQILEIEMSASDDEVKKAYRKMAVKYHPDKVSHLGPEHQDAAKEKFQKLTEAYERIKKERGIK